MKTVNKTAFGTSGLNALITNMNPVVTQAEGDKWVADITAAAKIFPEFCNTGNEDNDRAEFSAFLAIIGAETAFNTGAGFPLERENGCPDCRVCSYDSRGKLCENNTAL